ncbi:MAG: phosphatase PAP2 family protein [Oscillospiraceae bacterium]
MAKKERRIVFAAGLILLALFTFTDLPISMAVAHKPLWARVFEVVGEIPFTTLTIAACAILFRFRTRKNKALNILCAVGAGALFLLFSLMGGFMTYNYLTDNLGEISLLWMGLPALVMAGVGIWIAAVIPAENRGKALRYAAVALLYFVLVILIMNVLKTVWGRMRFREMTEPALEFTRWYQIVPRGGFDNIYASFPSGHSMNSAGVILLTLLPPLIPALAGREKLLRIIVYVWCVVVGLSRVFMGAHFASDVTVGILLSLAIFEGLRALLCRRDQAALPDGER